MKEHPILFSTSMVQALLSGQKTQTRRVVKPQPWHVQGAEYSQWIWSRKGRMDEVEMARARIDHCVWWDRVTPGRCMTQFSPYGGAGDHLWVRETWMVYGEFKTGTGYAYRADGDRSGKWRPSIFMPREASRITLEITGVRVERVQDISIADACAEGVTGCRDHLSNLHAVEMYRALWDSINGKTYPWSSNPWVWVVEFKRVPV